MRARSALDWSQSNNIFVTPRALRF